MEKINLSTAIKNLKRNWYFPISAMALFCLTMGSTLGYCIGLPLTLCIMVWISSRITSVCDIVRRQSTGAKLLCILSAVGICLGNQDHFYRLSLKVASKLALPEIFNKLFLCLSYVGALVAIFFVFFCLLIFWNQMKRVAFESGIFRGINKAEWIIYGLILAVTIGFMAYAFAKSQAFYGTNIDFDIIYTGDSPALVKDNAYLALTHTQNDLRQPLFALFAAPFMGIPYLIGKLFGFSAPVQAILLNIPQVIMLLSANLMVAKMMKLNPLKRVCFMILACCTYTHLLFTLMMEQYIVAYFWLILCMYFISEKRSCERIAMWGAGGTLLTSMVLLPFMSFKNPLKNFKAWFFDTVKYGLEFIVLCLVFCRFDVFFNLMSSISFLGGFTGKTVTFSEKLYQYTGFIRNCFVAPAAGVDTTTFEHISWQLVSEAGISLAGVIILVLLIISAVVNRDKTISRLSFVWTVFSAVMLLGLGWGTAENGLILYSLYFGWAFFALLFGLATKIEDKLCVKFIVPIVSAVSAIAMIAFNVPKILEMISFAIKYYPT